MLQSYLWLKIGTNTENSGKSDELSKLANNKQVDKRDMSRTGE